MSAETILLVEDNPDDVLPIRRAFQKAGVAHSFESLLDMVRTLERFWLVLAERPEAPRAHPSR